MDDLNARYFSAMEIPLWQPKVPQLIPLWRCLRNPEKPKAGVVLMGQKEAWELDLQQADGDLLNKILKAIDLDIDQCEVWLIADGTSPPASVRPFASKTMKVFCFGLGFRHDLPGFQLAPDQIVVLPLLTDMLNQREYKQQAWQTLKPWKGRL